MSMLDKDKVKEFADRIADINQQVQTDDVNFEQPVDTQWTVTVVGLIKAWENRVRLLVSSQLLKAT